VARATPERIDRIFKTPELTPAIRILADGIRVIGWTHGPLALAYSGLYQSFLELCDAATGIPICCPSNGLRAVVVFGDEAAQLTREVRHGGLEE
jgi:hypothetical protein